MSSYLLLRNPSANRVYADGAAMPIAAELGITAPFISGIAQAEVADVDYLAFDAERVGRDELAGIARQSSAFTLFQRDGNLLQPVVLPRTDVLDDNLVTIPKCQGKTDEQFTRLLLNVTVAAARRSAPHRMLDPMAGRGTIISTVLIAGCDAFGAEADDRAFDTMAALCKTWLHHKHIKRTAAVTPVRRSGTRIGRRFNARIAVGRRELVTTMFIGDARSSGSLYGKKRFDAIITDAPYGVVHGSTPGGRRSRTPAQLLAGTIPVWAGQLHPGGSPGISWGTFGMPREDLAVLLIDTGLEVLTDGAWDRFAHRVDSSIHRDLMVATKPVATD